MPHRPAPATSATTSLCSIRDAEQGVYEYLAEKHEPAPSLGLRAFAVPVRLSGWLWRREGLFRRSHRRFCVFDAATTTLAVFASDGPLEQRRVLARFVVTHVTLSLSSLSSQADAHAWFTVQGFVREREIHRDSADRLARHRRLSAPLPGDEQHFFLPETETLSAVSAKALRVWRHCFRSHMKSPTRLRRLRRLRRRWRRLEPALAGVDSEGDSDSDDSDDSDDTYGNPDFQFDEPERDQRRRHRRDASLVRRRHGRDSRDNDGLDIDADDADDDDAQLVFDQESALRITASDHALPSTTFFESADQDVSIRPDRRHAPSHSHQAIPSSDATSIWADDTLLSYRIDYDAITKLRRLAVGAFGEVWLAQYRNNQLVAVKHLRADATRRDNQRFVRELRLVSTLSHARVVRFLGVAWTMERDVRLVMEFVPRGDLRTFLDSVKRDCRDTVVSANDSSLFQTPSTWSSLQWRVAVDVAEALVYLHSLRPALVHCDLKSHNVLLTTDGHAKVADFGLSRYVADDSDSLDSDSPWLPTVTSDRDGTALGTGRWMAPEVLTGAATYSVASDVYAFGVLLSEIDTCALPFSDRQAPTEDVLVHRIVDQQWTPSFRDACPDAVRSLARQCFEVDARARPTALEAAYRLRKAVGEREAETGDDSVCGGLSCSRAAA